MHSLLLFRSHPVLPEFQYVHFSGTTHAPYRSHLTFPFATLTLNADNLFRSVVLNTYAFVITHADKESVDISVNYCLFVFLLLSTVTDFSGEDKASGVIFYTAVRRRPGQGISRFGELCSPRIPKSDE